MCGMKNIKHDEAWQTQNNQAWIVVEFHQKMKILAS